MNADNERRLREAFPALYRKELPFGFECGDGWFGILWELSESLDAESKATGNPPDSDRYPYAVQVKSKFCMLRWYGENLNEAMDALIEAASARASTSCETCGARGRLWVRRRWYRVCCDTHVPPGSQLVEDGKSG